jgi:membrane protease YdiL (CAAX protease family)
MKTLLQNKWMSIVWILLSIALIFNPILKFPYSFAFIILFVLAVTFIQKGNLEDLNFRNIGWKEMKIIVFSYVVMELSIDFIIQPFLNGVFNETADYSGFAVLEGKPKLFWGMMWKVWLSAAIGEEILFRGFIYAQLKYILGNLKPLVFILISSLLFAFPHFYQGFTGILLTFLIGIGFGYIYWKYQNIWINIIVHGLIDTVFLTLAYYGKLNFYEFTWW